jgi:hypothetical protein
MPRYLPHFSRIKVTVLNRRRHKKSAARGCAIKIQRRWGRLQYPVTAGRGAKANQQVHHWQTSAWGE